MNKLFLRRSVFVKRLFEGGRSPSLAVMSASTMKVLVTGGTSGLGLAMASALAAAGAGELRILCVRSGNSLTTFPAG